MKIIVFRIYWFTNSDKKTMKNVYENLEFLNDFDKSKEKILILIKYYKL